MNEIENTKKISEYKEKKENIYKHLPSKNLEISSEFENLNIKKQTYVLKITEYEQNIEKNKILSSQNNKKIEELEKEHKLLLENIGESYIKKKSTKFIMDIIHKKEKIRTIITKETNSKLTMMLSKIKSLQNELKLLKDNESNVNSQVWNALKRIDKYQDHLRYSPMPISSKSKSETRSHSVKPNFYPSFFTEISN